VLYILTCEHVVHEAHDVMGVFPSHSREEHKATILAVCGHTDLAVIECVTDFVTQAVQLGSSDELLQGDHVRAYGFPLSQHALKVTDGVYSGYQDRFLQHSAPISPGNSGGPLLCDKGTVIGVNKGGRPEGSNVAYAVPSHMVQVLLANLRGARPLCKKPLIIRKYSLGIHVHSTTTALIRHLQAQGCMHEGVRVSFMYQKSPLQGQLEVGDLVAAVDGKAVDRKGDMCVPWNGQRVDMFSYLERKSNYDEVQLQVWRKEGGCQQLTAQLADCKVQSFREIIFPHDPIEYVLFAGLVIMPLCANHEEYFPRLFATLTEAEQQKPQLIITEVIPGTLAYKAEVVRPGMRVDSVNGSTVTTLDEYRSALQQPVITADEPFLIFLATRHSLSRKNELVLPYRSVLEEHCAKRGKLWPTDADMVPCPLVAQQ
jgi:S1-C subfamily serine protease